MVTKEDFLKYHSDNPEIWEWFLRFARDIERKGYRTLSAGMIFELIRWKTMARANNEPNVNPDTGEPLKVSNNWRAQYARLWNMRFPDSPQFRTRATEEEKLNQFEYSQHELDLFSPTVKPEPF